MMQVRWSSEKGRNSMRDNNKNEKTDRQKVNNNNK